MADPFLEHRKQQEREHVRRTAGRHDPMNSLVSVEFNITELCNRTCEFCPRVDPEVYPNRNLNMSGDIVTKVVRDLASFEYRGRVSFTGFGEPMLHKHFPRLIASCRTLLPDNTIETNTNGDFLTVERTQELFASGLTYLYINLYDGPDQRKHFDEIMREAGIDASRYRLRDHWLGAGESYGLILNNRSGMVKVTGTAPEDLRGKPCHYPFYKMLIDWDGRVLFCSNDWGRKIVVGNVRLQHVRDVWMSKEMCEVRARLMRGDRSAPPCNTCNVEGTLHGKSSFDVLVQHYTGGPDAG